MNKAQLKRESRAGEVHAKIISDGCRDYVLHIGHKGGESLLCNRSQRPIRFRSLAEVNVLLSKCNVVNRSLAVRIADDEAGQPVSAEATFNDVPLAASSN